VSVGTFGRAFGTPCLHEHACVRCALLRPGRRLLSAECSIVDAENRVLIRSTATYMIIPTDGMVVAAGG